MLNAKSLFKRRIFMKKMCASYVFGVVGMLSCVFVPLEAKKLTDPKIALLNLALGGLPQVTARLKVSEKNSHDVCDILTKFQQEQASVAVDEKTSITKPAIDMHIKKMLDPVREFFAQILEHRDMVVPLIWQSLETHPSMKQGFKTLAESSYLLAFFNEHTKDIVEYFQKRITTEQDLNQIAHELKYFLGDLFESFSPHVLQSYDRMIKDIQAKKGTSSKSISSSSVQSNIAEELRKQKITV